jgi:hypothetical protein
MTPAQTAQKTSYVIAVVANAEGLANQGGDTRGGPDLRPVAMRDRSLEQQFHQPLTLPRVELGRPSWRESDAQGIRVSPVSRIAPAHDRNWRTTDQPPHLVQRAAFIQELQGTVSPSFQNLCGTTWSHREYPSGGYLL